MIIKKHKVSRLSTALHLHPCITVVFFLYPLFEALISGSETRHCHTRSETWPLRYTQMPPWGHRSSYLDPCLWFHLICKRSLLFAFPLPLVSLSPFAYSWRILDATSYHDSKACLLDSNTELKQRTATWNYSTLYHHWQSKFTCALGFVLGQGKGNSGQEQEGTKVIRHCELVPSHCQNFWTRSFG